MKERNAIPYAAYALTLLLFWGMALSPEGRVWGLNWWGYYGTWLPWTLVATGALVGLAVLLIPRFTRLTLQLTEGGGR